MVWVRLQVYIRQTIRFLSLREHSITRGPIQAIWQPSSDSPVQDVCIEGKERPPFGCAVLSIDVCTLADMQCASGGHEPCGMVCCPDFVRICGSQGLPCKSKIFCIGTQICVLGVLILGLLFASSAYFMKRDSADGRLLIGKITLRAIACNPWGEENGRTFSAIYGDAQERYFTDCEYSESEAWVAGTPDFAFNEYLQIAVEYGVWVSVLLVTVLLMLLKIAGSRKHLAGMGGCLVSLMIFACFSYPLHIPAIVSVWLLSAMALCGEGLVMIKRKRYAVAVLLRLLWPD